jgi:hypothetical protein
MRVTGLVLCCLGLLKFHGLLFPDLMATEYLRVANPIFFVLPNRWVLALAAVLETYVGLLAMKAGYPVSLRAGLVLWLSLATVAYKAGLVLVRYEGPCGCLLGFNRFLPMTMRTQKLVITILLPALIILSSSILIYDRLVRGHCGNGTRIASPAAAPTELH